jgi:hypothetical protein
MLGFPFFPSTENSFPWLFAAAGFAATARWKRFNSGGFSRLRFLQGSALWCNLSCFTTAISRPY